MLSKFKKNEIVHMVLLAAAIVFILDFTYKVCGYSFFKKVYPAIAKTSVLTFKVSSLISDESELLSNMTELDKKSYSDRLRRINVDYIMLMDIPFDKGNFILTVYILTHKEKTELILNNLSHAAEDLEALYKETQETLKKHSKEYTEKELVQYEPFFTEIDSLFSNINSISFSQYYFRTKEFKSWEDKIIEFEITTYYIQKYLSHNFMQ